MVARLELMSHFFMRGGIFYGCQVGEMEGDKLSFVTSETLLITFWVKKNY